MKIIRLFVTVLLPIATGAPGPIHAQDSLAQFASHTGAITRLDMTPRGDLLATAGRDGTVRIWSVPTGEERRRVRVSKGNAAALDFIGDERLLMAVPGGVPLVSVEDGDTLATFPTDGQVAALAVSPDNTAFAIAKTDGTVALWDLIGRRKMKTLDEISAELSAVTIGPGGRDVVAGDADGGLWRWQPATDTVQVSRSEVQAGGVVALALLPDVRGGAAVVSAHVAGPVILWDAAGRETARFAAGSRLHDMAVSPDGTLLTTVGEEGHATLWALPEGRAIRTFHAHKGAVRAVTFSQDGTRIVTGGDPYFAFVWPVPPPEMRAAAAVETALALTREDWRAVQTMLDRAGQDIGPVDGLPGPRTRAGLGDWQRGRGDEPTGYLTAGQKAAIRDADAGPQDTVPTPERRLGPAGPGQCHVIVAARRDRDAVARFVNALPDALKKSYSVATSRDGWLAISVGVVPRDGFGPLRQALVDTGQVPADTYCTRGTTLSDFNTDLPVFTGLIPLE